MNFNENQKGFVVSIIVFLILIIMLSISLSMSSIIFLRQRAATNFTLSSQSYYAAESGIEDALMRLRNDPLIPSITYSLNVKNAATTIVIPNYNINSRTILSEANNFGMIKKIQAVYSLGVNGANFIYGAQVGRGGLLMANGSEVKGSVFSNGNITGSGTIDNNVIVAENGNRIDGIHVKGDAATYKCNNSEIDGNLTYVMGGTVTNCTVDGTTTVQQSEIENQPLPISQEQIETWKNKASAGQLITGPVYFGNKETESLGPAKIIGSLTIDNNSTLKVTGILYVTGNITISNRARIQLDSSYGHLSGVILADGIITINNGTQLTGSGQTGSYLLVLSTDSSSSAIDVKNNTEGVIFYASDGGISFSNNVEVNQATAYQMTLKNNVILQYDTGLINTFFTAGPSGGIEVTGWGE